MHSDHRDFQSRFPRWPTWLATLALAFTTLIAGCRGGLGRPDARGDALEAELRTRERELVETRAERDRLKALTNLQQPYSHGGQPQWQAVPAYHNGQASMPIREISLAMGTGGVDEDGLPGDESLMVVIAPKDEDASAIKVAAQVSITAQEISREGLKTPIGKWEITPEQLRRTWRSSLLGSSYFVPLQWDKPPSTEKIRISVRLITSDGQTYETDKDVRVKPLPGQLPFAPGMPNSRILPPNLDFFPAPQRPADANPPATKEELPMPAARIGTLSPG